MLVEGMPALVRERMTSPALTLSKDAPVSEALNLFRTRRISAVPVMDQTAIVGVLSMSDVLELGRKNEAWEDKTIGSVMTPDVIGVAPHDTLAFAADKMVEENVHRLIVQDGLRIAGILSVRDVLHEVKRRRAMTPLSSIMSSPVETVDLGEPLDRAVERLATSGMHGLVVVDGTWPVGVFSQGEAIELRHVPPSVREHTTVEQVMSYETVCLDEGTPVYRAAGYAMAMDVRRILVVKNRDLVGIVSCLDLAGTLRA